MLIKSLQGEVYDVDLEEVYVKPKYSGDIIKGYVLCSNKRNQEVIIAEYGDKVIAKHMLHILKLYGDVGLEVSVLREVDLASDLWLQANERLRRAKEIYFKKERVQDESLYRR